jgi:hypothetical protein
MSKLPSLRTNASYFISQYIASRNSNVVVDARVIHISKNVSGELKITFKTKYSEKTVSGKVFKTLMRNSKEY